ncbi:MAG: dephospho-CoA kinase, partial [Bacteroidia bacterium]|nr:dephospho-CoA kinase [Bacteroidia bacterium]NNM16499.1 dephospho-CoA kinase [Bacteroidia bacterium]
PIVRNDFNSWTEKHSDAKYIINETAIVFSSGLHQALDKVICVISPLELRINRVVKRDDTDKESVEKIASQQLSDEERKEKSDFILYNNEEELLVPQIIKLHQTLIQLAL